MPEQGQCPDVRPSESGFLPGDSDPAGSSSPRQNSEQELEALRDILLGSERDTLAQLQARLDNPLEQARNVSTVIAEALLLRAGKDDTLSRVLTPLVENIFKASLRKDPVAFSQVLFPLMGPSIRRAIAEAFYGMLQGFHKSLEMSFSRKGLRWRFEAMRTGRPFSEIVLLHTLLFRVEQLFLIHSETGLMLAHIANEGVEGQDADMVSAMLTAIQDFAQDCFAGGREGGLESLQMGEYTLLVEKTPLAYLAAVVRGTPPMNFRQQLRGGLELILVECADPLVNFNGDTKPFAFARRHLESCMMSRFVNEDRPLPFWIKALPLVLVVSLSGGFGLWQHQRRLEAEAGLALTRQTEERKAAFSRSMEIPLAHLEDEPGLLIRSVRRGDTLPWEVVCLRDDAARDPLQVLAEGGAGENTFVVKAIPYISYDHGIVIKRVWRGIRPPEHVSMDFAANGTLRLSGTAPMRWIQGVQRKALALPGVRDVDVRGLSDPRMEQLISLIRDVESATVAFPLGKDSPLPVEAPKLEKAVENLVELEKLGREMGVAVSLTVYGYADSTGLDRRNYELSQARAKNLAAMLYTRGSNMPVVVYGMGAEYASKTGAVPADDQSSRRIELQVHLSWMNDEALEVMRK